MMKSTDASPWHDAQSLVVFDVCDTLYYENTTFGFIDYLSRRSVVERLAFRALTDRRSPAFWAFAVAERIVGVDISKWFALRLLRRKSEAALRLAANDYVGGVLTAKPVPQVHAKLRAHLANGDKVVLVSASLDIIVAEIASRLGTGWMASRLDFRDGRCEGRLVQDMTGQKLEAISALLQEGRDRSQLVVYTDNFSDRRLLEAADVAVVIVHGVDQFQKWNGMNVQFMDVGQ